jgi:hypothetical protein
MKSASGRRPTRRIARGRTKSISMRGSGRPSSMLRISASCSCETCVRTSAMKTGSEIAA